MATTPRSAFKSKFKGIRSPAHERPPTPSVNEDASRFFNGVVREKCETLQ
jgi:hypothetical protein